MDEKKIAIFVDIVFIAIGALIIEAIVYLTGSSWANALYGLSWVGLNAFFGALVYYLLSFKVLGLKKWISEAPSKVLLIIALSLWPIAIFMYFDED